MSIVDNPRISFFFFFDFELERVWERTTASAANEERPANHPPTPMAQYGKTAYWDERYTKDPEPFDWYQRYSGVRDLIAQYVKKEDNVLVAGCGNSRLSEDMYEDGYSSIANIDISRVVVDQMTEKYKEKPALTWQQMNVCSLEYPDESYDAVICKATMVRGEETEIDTRLHIHTKIERARRGGRKEK